MIVTCNFKATGTGNELECDVIKA